MMNLRISTLAIVALATLATAVDIILFPHSTDCNEGSAGVAECKNIDRLVCCRKRPNGADIFSVRFRDLVSEGAPAFGIIYGEHNGLSCGKECNNRHSNGCLDPGHCPAGNGAGWVKHITETSESVPNKHCVLADTARFTNGQQFRVNHDVPTNITDLIFSLQESDPGLEGGVPDEILPYERFD